MFLISMAWLSCGRKHKSEENFIFELMKMEELGKVDSSTMAHALLSENIDVVKAAAGTCGVVRDNRFLGQLAELCLHHNDLIREAAIFALGEIKDASSINSLFAVLHSEDAATRLMAMEALGKIGDKKAASFIKPFLRSSGDEECEAALALWRMSDTSSLDDLRVLARKASGCSLYGATYSMFRLFPGSCVPEFLNVFDNPQSRDSVYAETATIAARGLGLSGDTAAAALVFRKYYNILPRPAKIELIRSLGIMQIECEGLEKLLETTDDNGLKEVILSSLGRIGKARSKRVVEKYLRDPSLQVQLAAISSLPDIDRKSPADELERLKTDKRWQVRAAVAESLGKAKSDRSLKQLRLLLEDNDDRVKAAVIEGLGEFPVKRNIDIIKAALNGSDDIAVKSVAAEILGASGDSSALKILIETAEKNINTDDLDFARSLVTAIGNFVDSAETAAIASETIKKFLDYKNRIVRQDAWNALGENAPEYFDPGIFEVDFNEEYYRDLRDLAKKEIIATIETMRGTIRVRLEPGTAPRTVANFIRLAEKGFYDNLTFHRVIQNFVIQGGCPRGDGWGGPGYMIREEINPIRFKRGTIGMASSGRDTGGSQFFICLSAQPHLDGGYTAFGNVIGGWDVLDKIELGDMIHSIKIEKGRF